MEVIKNFNGLEDPLPVNVMATAVFSWVVALVGFAVGVLVSAEEEGEDEGEDETA